MLRININEKYMAEMKYALFLIIRITRFIFKILGLGIDFSGEKVFYIKAGGLIIRMIQRTKKNYYLHDT